MVVVLDQIVWQTAVQQSIDVQIMLYEVVDPLIVLPHALALDLVQLFVRLPVLLPLVSRIREADQSLTAHLRCVEQTGLIAQSSTVIVPSTPCCYTTCWVTQL